MDESYWTQHATPEGRRYWADVRTGRTFWVLEDGAGQALQPAQPRKAPHPSPRPLPPPPVPPRPLSLEIPSPGAPTRASPPPPTIATSPSSQHPAPPPRPLPPQPHLPPPKTSPPARHDSADSQTTPKALRPSQSPLGPPSAPVRMPEPSSFSFPPSPYHPPAPPPKPATSPYLPPFSPIRMPEPEPYRRPPGAAPSAYAARPLPPPPPAAEQAEAELELALRLSATDLNNTPTPIRPFYPSASQSANTHASSADMYTSDKSDSSFGSGSSYLPPFVGESPNITSRLSSETAPTSESTHAYPDEKSFTLSTELEPDADVDADADPDLAEAIRRSKLDMRLQQEMDASVERVLSSSASGKSSVEISLGADGAGSAEGEYSWVDPSETNWRSAEGTFVKKERMRQAVELGALKEWQENREDVSSEWHTLVNPDTLAAFDEKEVSRQSAIFEFLKTEKQYLRDLEFLQNVFIPPLENEDIIPSPARESFLSEAIHNLPALIVHHRRMLSKAYERQAAQHPLLETIVDLVLDGAIEWQGDYEEYIKHWPLQEARIKNEIEKNPKFARHMEECGRHAPSRQSILALLQRPVFRLPRYPLLLNRIFENTAPDHADQDTLPLATRIITDVVRATQPGVEAAKGKVRFWEYAGALEFRAGEIHDMNLLDETRTLVHDGLLWRQKSLLDNYLSHGWNGYQVVLFDNYLVMTQAQEHGRSVKYAVTSRPIPLELLGLDKVNPSPTHRTACVFDTQRRADGSRILFTQIEPERVVHGFRIRHLGSGKEYKLYASSERERDRWKTAIRDAIAVRRARIEANRIFSVSTISSNTFRQAPGFEIDRTAPGRVTSACPFRWSQSDFIAISCPTGVFLSYRGDPSSMRRVIKLPSVEQVLVLPKHGIMLVLCDTVLWAYDLEEILPTSAQGPRRTPGGRTLNRGSEKVLFVRAGTVENRTIVVYASNRRFHQQTVCALQPLTIKARSDALLRSLNLKSKREDWVKDYGSPLNIPAEVLDICFPGTSKIALLSQGRFTLINPLEPTRTLEVPEIKMAGEMAYDHARALGALRDLVLDSRPLGIFPSAKDEYLLVYDTLGVFISCTGAPLRRAHVVRWEGTVRDAAVDGPFLLLFSPEYIEVRILSNARLWHVTLHGREIRCAWARGTGKVRVVGLKLAERKPSLVDTTAGARDHVFELMRTVSYTAMVKELEGAKDALAAGPSGTGSGS